jgi:LysR family glycine cleavage system transcriptional activator
MRSSRSGGNIGGVCNGARRRRISPGNGERPDGGDGELVFQEKTRRRSAISATAAGPAGLRVQLSASHSESDFSRREVDLDIRDGALHARDLHVETIFREQILPLASPALLQRLAIRVPADLIGQPLILSDVNLVQWPRWFAAHGVPLSPGTYALEFDRAYMAIGAAAQGLGIALESDRLAEAALRCGELVPVFADRKGIELHAHHLVYPKPHGAWKKVERFAGWVRKEAGRRA